MAADAPDRKTGPEPELASRVGLSQKGSTNKGMKIAVAQIACSLGQVAANVDKMQEFCARAKEDGAQLIVFPEMADTGYATSVIQACATSWNEGAVPALRKCAQHLSLAVIAGVSERDSGGLYNTQIFIDAAGQVCAKYRKTHLFAVAPVEEQKCFAEGGGLTSYSLGGFNLGLSICYDLRFPELYRALALEKGTNVFIISSAWPFPRLEHFRILAVARAIENQSYVIASNRVGTDAGATFCGSSAVIDPYGVIVAAASADREELIVANLSTEPIESVRQRMPVLAHRRRDLY
jgi:omega-amidase